MITNIVQDGQTDYVGFDDFCRHAVMELLQAYVKAGWPDVGLGAELAYEKAIRRQSHQAQRRQEVRESLHKYDDELDIAIQHRDWEYINGHLEYLEGCIRDAPTEGMKQVLRREIAHSTGVRRAVEALNTWVDARVVDASAVRERGDRWRGALEDWLVD